MENKNKRVNIKFTLHWSNIGKKIWAESLIGKPNFKTIQIFSDNFIAVQLNRSSVLYNKPVCVGFSILTLSKIVIYDFYCNYFKKEYDTKLSLLYADTDSLIFEIFIENFYDEIKKHIHLFDISKYTAQYPKLPIIGEMKNKYKGLLILRFLVLLQNLIEDKATLKAKCVGKGAVQKYVMVNSFKEIVEILVTMYSFRCHLHTLYTELQKNNSFIVIC